MKSRLTGAGAVAGEVVDGVVAHAAVQAGRRRRRALVDVGLAVAAREAYVADTRLQCSCYSYYNLAKVTLSAACFSKHQPEGLPLFYV